jgi:predicted nucleotidyltransferase
MQDELANIVGRKVDLLEEAALRNPYRRATFLQSKHILYAS